LAEAPGWRGSESVKGSKSFDDASGREESGETGKNPGEAWWILNVYEPPTKSDGVHYPVKNRTYQHIPTSTPPKRLTYRIRKMEVQIQIHYPRFPRCRRNIFDDKVHSLRSEDGKYTISDVAEPGGF
jgi:hypothetical protein